MGWRKRIRIKDVKAVPGQVHQRPEASTASPERSGPDRARASDMLLDPLLGHPANLARRAEALRAGQRRFGNRAVRRFFGGRSRRLNQRADPSLLRSPWVRAAQAEEKSGQAYEVPPEVAGVLEEQRSHGRPLEAAVRKQMEASLGQGFRSVRVHDDPAADRLARWFRTAAFTIGSHVFLRQSDSRSRTQSGQRILQHELAHVAGQGDRKRVRFWGGAIHKQITRTVAQQYNLDAETIRKLEDISPHMDWRVRRLARAAVPFTPILGGAAAGAAIGSLLGPVGALVGGLVGGVAGALATPLGLTRFPPEGPEHGEGGQYDMELGAARAVNMAVQQQRLREAIEAYNFGRASGGREGKDALQGQVLEKMGDALHIAQDRGSHWEGARGMGHDDPRHKHMLLGWSPDNVQDNPLGYANALRNTREVLKAFLEATHYPTQAALAIPQAEKPASVPPQPQETR